MKLRTRTIHFAREITASAFQNQKYLAQQKKNPFFPQNPHHAITSLRSGLIVNSAIEIAKVRWPDAVGVGVSLEVGRDEPTRDHGATQ